MNNIKNITKSGERLSFFKLFNEKGYHIEIPIIQRDYAHGRDSSSEVREMFLDSLYSYLEENRSNRDLDFIYGSISTTDNKSSLILLDGQQRITTLYLLHWYLANISNNMDVLKQTLAIKEKEEYKSKFTYETRTSSKEFCDALITNDVNMSQLLQSDKEKQNSLSKSIQNYGWFFLSWKNDPTIQSMLTMLDSIHLKFGNNPEFFNRLIDKDNPIITFLFLNLKEFKLTDDLYIKMNSRGIPLTSFENFKAKFEQRLGKLEWKEKDLRKLKFKQEGKEEMVERVFYPKEYFSHKIDTDWIHLFWNYRNVGDYKENKENYNSFDNKIMNFIRVVLANEYAGKKATDQNLEFIIGTQVAHKSKDYSDNLSYNTYEKLGILNESSVSYLIDALDVLENGEGKIQKYLADDSSFNENEIFEKVLEHNLTFPQRIQFHAYLRYLICNKGNSMGLNQWMRVIYNLTENTPIDGAKEVASAIVSIDKLISNSLDILNYLKKDKNKVDFFYGRQVQEEKIKSHLITKSDKWLKAIEEIEKHTYFKGQISFILEFSEILSYYEDHLDCDWTDNSDGIYFSEFSKYANCAAVTFDAIDSNKKRNSESINYLWERVVLSKGDYLIESSSYRKNLLNSTTNMRDYSWKRLLRLTPQDINKDEEKKWKERRGFVKEIYDDQSFKKHDLKNSLAEICKSVPTDWRKYFIETPQLIEYCKQGFIRFESSSDIILFMHSQQNHRQREMYTYHFYLNNLSNINIAPFNNFDHKEVSNSSESSYVFFSGFCLEKIMYELRIYYGKPLNGISSLYQIGFIRSNSENDNEYYSDRVKEILKQSNFKWNRNIDSYGFWNSAHNEKETLEIIQSLLKNLNLIK